MNDDTVCDEVRRIGFREIVHSLFAGIAHERDLVHERLSVCGYGAVHRCERIGFRRGRVEADFLFEHYARRAADPKRMHFADRVLLESAAAVRQHR